ncbi:myc box-dependent-interacting protein 1-like isoform X4 [Tigriopus californicus]|uniref:myc box-dependent-interacting protein 1-like isoform X4 n=1 Tax=Tigriopus californicus TaxID=6832 RepID=UPI0027D9EF48|nr:myc box-dependent-interacting protein 1-like isoform X4 [Tigriopus californicus]
MPEQSANAVQVHGTNSGGSIITDQIMAEARGIAKLVQKQAGRAKEKLLQNLGKADKTTDDIFEEHLQNFNLQQAHANRLHKDISNYIRCIKAMQNANKNLMETLAEVYESQWTGHDLLYVQSQNQEMLWADLAHKLSDQVLIPLNTYQGQFPEMRKKIDKRGRKLIDYDKERHVIQSMQNSAGRNEGKFARAKEQMELAKRTYEILNSELHDELPALYDSRALFLVTNMQTLFAAEEVFHTETSKVFSELEAIIDKLAKEVQRGTLPRKVLPKPLPLASPTSFNSSPTSNSLSSPPKGASTDNLPSGVLYKVKASYKYQAEDGDELNFDVGEVIQVIPYEDPEEQQEEGWLTGIKESTGEKGMFPANFTRPI